MIKINNVIAGLKCCINANDDGCEECPYRYKSPCQKTLWEDAIEVLNYKKEQVEKWYIDMDFSEFYTAHLYSMLHKIIDELKSRDKDE